MRRVLPVTHERSYLRRILEYASSVWSEFRGFVPSDVRGVVEGWGALTVSGRICKTAPSPATAVLSNTMS
ncbi:hypothetical protein [Paenibacillus sp. Root52]|uniref:hypothetical protein n=1 Tax=Paenibacillus sp. Root52 TaxID=1736552 RepID=UPI0012E37E49|nr:hypothetical protein [Paenibacillus sp. Root52]